MVASKTPIQAQRPSLGLHALCGMFFRHKKKAAFFALTVAAVAVLVILYAPRTYRSEARLFLQVGRESVRLDPTATTGDTIALQQSGRDSEIATAIEVLKSRTLLEKTVDAMTPDVVLGEPNGSDRSSQSALNTLLTPLHAAIDAIKRIDPISKREEAIISLEENLQVYAEFDSALIVMTLDADSPRLAQRILDRMVSIYRDEHMRLYRTSGSKPFFERQRGELETQLADAESKLQAAKNRMGLASIESRRETIEQRLSSVELAGNATAQQVASAQARIAALKDRIASLPERLHAETRVMPNTGADALRSQLYALQVQLMNLEAKYHEEHPLVKSARAQVDEASQMVLAQSDSRQETVDAINGNHQSLSLALAKAESDLAGYQAQQAVLLRQQAVALADLRELNDYEVELEQRNRAVTLARTNYLSYATAYEKARMDEELDRQRISNVNVAQQATLAEKPISPSKLLVGVLSLLFIASGTICLVVACEALDGRLQSEEQVERLLQLPVVTTVPEARLYASVPAGV
jgi:polysaccharide biosynthesis protein PslE